MSPDLAVYGLVQRLPERYEPFVWLPAFLALVIANPLQFPTLLGALYAGLRIDLDDRS